MLFGTAAGEAMAVIQSSGLGDVKAVEMDIERPGTRWIPGLSASAVYFA
jgi:hypothetical protein